jgi:hypothetical protein
MGEELRRRGERLLNQTDVLRQRQHAALLLGTLATAASPQ